MDRRLSGDPRSRRAGRCVAPRLRTDLRRAGRAPGAGGLRSHRLPHLRRALRGEDRDRPQPVRPRRRCRSEPQHGPQVALRARDELPGAAAAPLAPARAQAAHRGSQAAPAGLRPGLPPARHPHTGGAPPPPAARGDLRELGRRRSAQAPGAPRSGDGPPLFPRPTWPRGRPRAPSRAGFSLVEVRSGATVPGDAFAALDEVRDAIRRLGEDVEVLAHCVFGGDEGQRWSEGRRVLSWRELADAGWLLEV